jgi:hypothetical protein
MPKSTTYASRKWGGGMSAGRRQHVEAGVSDENQRFFAYVSVFLPVFSYFRIFIIF